MTDYFRHSDKLALWRYGIISPLLHRNDDSPPLYRELCTLSQRSFFTPDGVEKNLSADTLRLWLWRYKNMGIAGLRNKVRRDRGASKIPDILCNELVRIRKEHPLYTVKRLLKELLQNELWNGRKPSRTALYRFTATNGLNRNIITQPENVRLFEYPYFGDLWSGDFLHGPKIKEGIQTRKTYLHTIIDDATRYVVVANFHLAENTESLLNDLMLAVQRFGMPKRFYTDNGAAFRSNHLKMVAAKMSIALPHTPPYKPRGRVSVR